jgi:hypothetical protein
VVNSNDTISYYYSNGTVVTLETYTMTEFPDTDTRYYEISFSNGTVLTYKRDGSEEI